MIMTDLCQELHNWFVRERHSGRYVISGGTIDIPFLQEGQYYRILGSVFNDGVHIYRSYELRDETFDGEIWAMAIPDAVIDLGERIVEWKKKYTAADSPALSPFISESFGGYSYTKGSGSSAASSGGANGWKGAFSDELNRWRKIGGSI